MTSKRLLTNNEIEGLIDFIVPEENIPTVCAMSITDYNKNGYRHQLKDVKVYPSILPKLKETIRKDYLASLIQAGESVGVIGAQSIGQKNTQTTLNSVDWSENMAYSKNGIISVEPIGKLVDRLLKQDNKRIIHIKENRTEYLDIPSGYMVPSTNMYGEVKWYDIEAITRHLPVGKLVRVLTSSGRTVTASQSKSFLVWNGKFFDSVKGSEVKVGDLLPTTISLPFKSVVDKIMLNNDQIILTPDIGFLIGLYISGGSCTKNSVTFYNLDKNLLDRVLDIMIKLKTIVVIREKRLEVFNPKLAEIMYKTNNIIPNYAYTAPMDFIINLLDGVYSNKSIINNNSIVLELPGQFIVHGISFLLSYLGIHGVLKTSGDNGNYTTTLKISGHFASNFARIIQLSNITLQTMLDGVAIVNDNGTHQFSKDVLLDKVVSVDYVYGTTDMVYDLTVKTTRNFQLFNGLNCRDTFHKAGVSEKTMVSGVPRFQELLNATKKPNIVNHKIYYKKKHKSIQDLRKTVNSSIAGLTMEDICETMEISMNKKAESWYDVYNAVYDDDRYKEHKNCISIKLNAKKLLEYRLSLKNIADFIHKEYGDLFCVFSPPQLARLDIYTDTETCINLPNDRVTFIDTEFAPQIYMEECVFPTISKLCVCGVPSVLEIFYTKMDGTDEEWFIETNSLDSSTISSQFNSYKKIMALPGIDTTRTVSNNIWDIYKVLGVEAARQFLIEEFMSLMDGISSDHAKIIADRMTYNGGVDSITRYTLREDASGPLGKASFEETQDNFISAASRGDIDPTRGVSASLICGKRAEIGTGMSELSIDISQLPLAIENDEEIDITSRLNELRNEDDDEEYVDI